LFFTDVLEERLLRFNPEFMDVALAGEVIRRLNLLRPTIEGNREAQGADAPRPSALR
jgi:hypothetical protein